MSPGDEIEFDPGLFSLENPPPASVKPPSGAVRSPTPVPGAPENNRRHLRFKVDGAQASMYVKRMLSSLGLGRSGPARKAVNLSEGGLLVASTSSIQPGTTVHVRLEIEKYQDVIETDALVRWCRASAREDGVFYIGVEFQNLDDALKKKIARMRDWFTSPEYRLRAATRKRQES